MCVRERLPSSLFVSVSVHVWVSYPVVSVSVYGVNMSVSGVVPSCCELSNKEPNDSDN